MEKTHINVLQTVAQDTPLFWVMLGLAALIAVGEVALIAQAVRKRTSGRLAIAAAVAPVLLAAAMVVSIQIGRASLLRGLATDDPVRVFNDLGEVHCPIALNKDIRPGTVSLPKGLWRRSTFNGSTSNALVPDSLTDLGQGACFNDARVQVASLGRH